eukprot:999399-Rhodomonas_salina.1
MFLRWAGPRDTISRAERKHAAHSITDHNILSTRRAMMSLPQIQIRFPHKACIQQRGSRFPPRRAQGGSFQTS